MKLLGAVLAGGASSRFGSDKALAVVDGRPLIDGVIAALAAEVDDVVVCGRDWPGSIAVSDVPEPGLGPLGGLCAALFEAKRRGFDAVLSAPCDALDLPPGLAERLAPGPAVALGQRTVGLWPAALAPALLALLEAGGDRSLRRWMAVCGAREVDCGAIANINRPAELPQG